MSEDEFNKAKQVEYYAASVSAWFDTALERDKTLVTLSAAGIGLMVTPFGTSSVHSIASLVLAIVAILCFVVCVIFVLLIFRHNKNHIEAVLAGKPVSKALWWLDNAAMWSFISGVLCAAAMGIGAAVEAHSVSNESHAKENSLTKNSSKPTGVPTFDSVYGMKALNPDLGKSFNNMGNLQPPSSTPVASGSGGATATPAAPIVPVSQPVASPADAAKSKP